MSMDWVKRICLLGAAASLTSGCIMYRLEELRNTTPSGSPFQTELARLYMDFATQEEKDYDWQNSWHFADKGLMLAYGKDMPPEALEEWSLPKEALPEMEKARARVMALLTPDIINAQPAKAAAMQFYFDCWVEQQEENWQDDDIAYCRDNLLLTIGELSGPAPKAAARPRKEKKAAMASPEMTPAPAPEAKAFEPKASPVPEEMPKVAKEAKEAPKEAPKEVKEAKKAPEAQPVKERAVETASYAVFFETGKAELSRPGQNVIDEVIRSLKDSSDYQVVLHTASETAAAEADDALSLERAAAVKKLLAAGGISESAIATGKDTKAPGRKISRRVELFLNE